MSDYDRKQEAFFIRMFAVVFSLILPFAVLMFWAYRPYGVWRVEDPQPTEAMTGLQSALNDPGLSFRYGEKVEITTGFFRGYHGEVVNVDERRVFTVALDTSQPGMRFTTPKVIGGLNASSLKSSEVTE